MLPNPRSQADHRGLIRFELDLGKLELLARDAIAGFVVAERVVAARLDRYPDLA
jgi:hypothetical protein